MYLNYLVIVFGWSTTDGVYLCRSIAATCISWTWRPAHSMMSPPTLSLAPHCTLEESFGIPVDLMIISAFVFLLQIGYLFVDYIVDLLVGDMVHVGDSQDVAGTSHLHGLYSYFELCVSVHVLQV